MEVLARRGDTGRNWETVLPKWLIGAEWSFENVLVLKVNAIYGKSY